MNGWEDRFTAIGSSSGSVIQGNMPLVDLDVIGNAGCCNLQFIAGLRRQPLWLVETLRALQDDRAFRELTGLDGANSEPRASRSIFATHVDLLAEWNVVTAAPTTHVARVFGRYSEVLKASGFGITRYLGFHHANFVANVESDWFSSFSM